MVYPWTRLQPQSKAEALSVSGCLKIDVYFGISQEH
jgi:hypothetical protein